MEDFSQIAATLAAAMIQSSKADLGLPHSEDTKDSAAKRVATLYFEVLRELKERDWKTGKTPVDFI